MTGEAPSSGGRRWHATAILVVALLAGLGLRATLIEGRTVFSHDGAISYLAAAGQQGRLAEVTRPGSTEPPYARWVRVEQWQAFVEPSTPMSPRTIARDLSAHDLHPPLYFWLLHVACLTLGAHPWTGILLNALIDAAAALVIFAAARWWLDDDRWAAIATLVWMISPAALETMREARHYSLLALVGVAFAWQAVRIVVERRPVRMRDYALFALLTAVGALTHYHFAMVGFAALVLTSLWSGRRKLARLTGAMAVGVSGALVANPSMLATFTRAGDLSDPVTLDALGLRVLKVGYHLFDLWGATDAGNIILGVAALAGLTLILTRHARGERAQAAIRAAFGPERNPFMMFALIVFALISAAYLSFAIPRHAIGPRYFAPVWPLMAIGFVDAIRHLDARRWLLAGLIVFALANSVWLVSDFLRSEAWNQSRMELLREYDHLLVDQVGRGALLPLLAGLDAGTMVYVAHPQDIIASVDDWAPALRMADGSKGYLSNAFQATSHDDRRAVLALLDDLDWETPESPLRLVPTWRLFPLK